MRVNLYWRGIDLIDMELHVFRPRDEQTGRSEPTSGIEASGGGQAERAEPYGDPATQHGFGFCAPRQPVTDREREAAQAARAAAERARARGERRA